MNVGVLARGDARFPVEDLVSVRHRQTKALDQAINGPSLFGKQPPHLVNLRIRELGATMRLATSKALRLSARIVGIAARKAFPPPPRWMGIAAGAALGIKVRIMGVAVRVPSCADRVFTVILDRARSQMCRVAAWRIVARVKDEGLVGRDAALVGDNPCHAMGIRIPKSCGPESSIAIGAPPSPLPAFAIRSLSRRPINLGPEPGGIGRCDIIRGKHRNLFSGGPVGVTSTATGVLCAHNYSTGVPLGRLLQTVDGARG